MFKWVESGKFFSNTDVSKSRITQYTNLTEEPEVNLYANLSKTESSTNLINYQNRIYIHGIDNTDTFPFFEMTEKDGLPITVNFKMKITSKTNDYHDIGVCDYFFMVDEQTPNSGAFGIKYITALRHVLIPALCNNNDSLIYPLTDSMKTDWFDVTITMYTNVAQLAVNGYIINTVKWSSSYKNGFRLRIKGEYFNFDYSDITVSRMKNVVTDVEFEPVIGQSDVTNGTITLTAGYTLTGE